jgi:hypothetical protein
MVPAKSNWRYIAPNESTKGAENLMRLGSDEYGKITTERIRPTGRMIHPHTFIESGFEFPISANETSSRTFMI